MGKELLGNEITNVLQVRRLSWITRSILASSSGVIITSAVFLLMTANKAPRELNYVLMPGAIVALVVGFVTHYGEYYYAATLLGANVIFYGLLAYIVLGLAALRPRVTPGRR
jgi:hypothetical protein